MIGKLLQLRRKCLTVETSTLGVVLRFLYYSLRGRKILASKNVRIRGLENIEIQGDGLLQIGMDFCGFVHPDECTYLNIRGKLIVKGNLQIGKGCRFDIGPDAVAEFGSGYVGPDTTFIIAHRISVGSGCAISWSCQFLDESFHHLDYPGRTPKPPGSITIGNNVWIGSKAAVMKGAVIPDGSVISSGTRISSAFTSPNCLIDGNPPKVVKEQVTWS